MANLAGEDSIQVETDSNSPGAENDKDKGLSGEKTSVDPGSWRQLPFDPSVRHPLKHTWVLSYDSQMKDPKKPGNAWGESIKEIFTFSTVEDFWRMYNNIAPPSQLSLGCNYNLFQKGIEPKWEDVANAKGGKWTLIVPKNKSTSVRELDKLWLWLMLACIGEIIDEDFDQVCGCVVNVRKQQDKLCLWTKDAEASDVILKIGQNMKRKTLELPDNFPCGYQAHYAPNTRANKHQI